MPFDSLGLLLLLISLCAGACLVVYALLALFQRRYPFAACLFGSLALVGWLLLFGGFALLAGMDWEGNRVAFPYALVAGVGAALTTAFVSGGWLHRRAISFPLIAWHGVLFCAFYYAVFHLCALLIYARFSWATWMLLNEIRRPLNVAGSLIDDIFRSEVSSTLGVLLVWSFPLGAPLAAILLARLKRGLSDFKR